MHSREEDAHLHLCQLTTLSIFVGVADSTYFLHFLSTLPDFLFLRPLCVAEIEEATTTFTYLLLAAFLLNPVTAARTIEVVFLFSKNFFEVVCTAYLTNCYLVTILLAKAVS